MADGNICGNAGTSLPVIAESSFPGNSLPGSDSSFYHQLGFDLGCYLISLSFSFVIWNVGIMTDRTHFMGLFEDLKNTVCEAFRTIWQVVFCNCC